MPASQLELEVNRLQLAVAAASKNSFLPHAVRDAIVQAGKVITTLAGEVNALRIQADVHRDKLHEMQALSSLADGQEVH